MPDSGAGRAVLAAVACPFLLERLGLAGWHRLSGTGLACAGIFLLLHGVNRRVYQRDPAWAEFSEYNRLRGKFMSLGFLSLFHKQIPRLAGAKTTDGCFPVLFFRSRGVRRCAPDAPFFRQVEGAGAGRAAIRWWGFSAGFLFLPKVFRHDAATLMELAILNGLWCIVAAGVFRRRCLATLLISYGLYMGLSFYFLTTARLPEHVSYNIPLFIHAICLYWATGFHNQPAATNRPDRLDILLAPPWRAAKALTVWAALYHRGALSAIGSSGACSDLGRCLSVEFNRIGSEPMVGKRV